MHTSDTTTSRRIAPGRSATSRADHYCTDRPVSARTRVERTRTHGELRSARHRRRPTGSSAAASSTRGRGLVGVVLAVVFACSIVLAHDVLAGSNGLPASADSSRPATPHTVVVAQPGDSLWVIAERHRGDVSIERYVELLVRLNGGPSVQAGQDVVLP